MSIETLLEAAKFLELQAQQQQRARDENALCERLCLEQERGKCKSKTSSTLQTSHANPMNSEEESSPEPHQIPPSTLPPSSILPSPIPVTVVSLPVASPNVTPLHKSVAPSPTLPLQDSHSPPSQHALYQQAHLPPQSNGLKPDQLVQPFPSTLVRPQQQSLIPQPVSSPTQLSIMVKATPSDDNLDSKKRPGGAGTREVHNKLEKNRRAHLKECFETLKKNIPNVDEKKTSNLSVLRSALRYIQTLKRKEKEYEHEMERLAREKISTQQRLSDLKNDLSQGMDIIEIERLVRQTVQPEDDQASTSTASEGEDNIDEDMDEEDTATLPYSLPAVPHTTQPDISKAQVAPPPSQHVSVLPKPFQPQPHITVPCTSVPVHPSSSSLTLTPAHSLVSQKSSAMVAPPNLTYGHIVAAPSLQPTVITHAASHASVIQAVNHVTQNGPKHIAHIASSTSSSSSPNALQLAPGTPTIRHITVHPVTHLPSIYPQPVTIAHTLSHSQAIGTPPLAKQTPVGNRVLAHHSQLVGQTVLNPVTMVTMPSFPVSTLKLA